MWIDACLVWFLEGRDDVQHLVYICNNKETCPTVQLTDVFLCVLSGSCNLHTSKSVNTMKHH